MIKKENSKNSGKNIIVVYHGECPDGFSGAWAAWKKFGEEAEYLPAHHGESFSFELKDKEVFLIDFVPDESTIKKLLARNASVFPIDHHLTSEIKMKLFKECVFNMKKSGAVLSWEYFHPNEPMPLFLGYVQDRDLWNWRLENSKELSVYLNLVDMDFSDWSEIAERIENVVERAKIINQGALLLKYENKLIEMIIGECAESVEFEGIKTFAVNCPIFESEIGNRLVKKFPPIGIIWRRKKNYVTVSLRSDGSVDVSAIAKKYGGGGHKAAAGFEFSLDAPFPWKRVNEK